MAEIKDILPAWRNQATPFHLRIGDSAFFIPPTFIKVTRTSDVSRIRAMRQKNSMKVAMGYARTQIQLTLIFGSQEHINGYRVPGPHGFDYFMDGLRPLLAQFRRTPILPVENEFLNDLHDIHTVAMAGLSINASTDIPNAVVCNLILVKSTVEPHILRPDSEMDDMICWPLFRWYYQQMIMDAPEASPPSEIGVKALPSDYVWKGEGDTAIWSRKMANMLGLPITWNSATETVTIGGMEFKPWKVEDGKAYVDTRDTAEALGFTVIWNQDDETISFKKTSPGASGRSSSIYLKPLTTTDLAGNIRLWLLDGGAVERGEIANIQAGVSWVEAELSKEITCTSVAVSMENVFTDQYLQLYSDPSHQYLGSMEVGISLQFMTIDREMVQQLNELKLLSENHSITLRDEFVGGFIRVENELVQMAGVTHCLVEVIEIETVTGTPDLFRISMVLTAFDPNQKDQERVTGFRPFESDNTMVELLSQVESVLMKDDNVPAEMVHSMLAERYLAQVELYPDLELPTYAAVDEALKVIDRQRKTKGLEPLNFKPYVPPILRETDHSGFRVDPDFYVRYEHLTMGGLVNPSAIMKSLVDDTTPLKADTGDEPPAVSGSNPIASGDHWAIMEQYASKYGVEPELIAAVGFIETHWGRDGQGTKGYYMGVGCPDDGSVNPEFYGLTAQLDWAVPKLAQYIGTNVTRDRVESMRVNGYHTTDPNWTNNVFTQYNYYKKHGHEGFSIALHPNDGLGAVGAGASGVASQAGWPEWIALNKPPEFVCDYGKLIKLPNHDTKEGLAEIMKMMGHDWLSYSCDGRLVKAYPTFCLAILDEGQWMSGFRTWTNYYFYHSVVDITVVKDREIPADLAIISLTNVYGNLNTKPRYKPHDKPGLWEVLFPRLNEDMVAARSKILNRVDIRAGCRVHLRMGYGSVASCLPVAFNGSVAEKDASDLMTLVCQGDGVELVDPITEWDPNQQNSVFNIGKNPWVMFYEIMAGRPWYFNIGSAATSEGSVPQQAAQNVNVMHGIEAPGEDILTRPDFKKYDEEFRRYISGSTGEIPVLGALYRGFVAPGREDRKSLIAILKGIANPDDIKVVTEINRELAKRGVAIPDEVNFEKAEVKEVAKKSATINTGLRGIAFGAENRYGIEHFGQVYKNESVPFFIGADTQRNQEYGDKIVSVYDVMKNIYGHDPTTGANDPNLGFLWELTGLSTKSVQALPEAPTDEAIKALDFVDQVTYNVKFGLLVGKGMDEAQAKALAYGAVKGKTEDIYQIQMYIGGKSPWDIFNIISMTQRERILAVHPYMFRSTLFYGKQYWPIKYAMRIKKGQLPAGGVLKKEQMEELYKVYSQFWYFNSSQNVLSNKIRASAVDICTNVAAMYSIEGTPKMSKTIKADKDIKIGMQKTEIFDSSTTQDSLIPNIIPALSTIMPLLGAKGGEERAMEMCRAHLKRRMRNMYQGGLIVTGCVPKPYDMFYLSDAYTKMNGVAEIGRVVIRMSFDTGFVTEIKPDLACAIACNDLETKYNNPLHWLFTGWGAHGLAMAVVLAKWKLFANASAAAKKAKKAKKNYGIMEKLIYIGRNLGGQKVTTLANKVFGITGTLRKLKEMGSSLSKKTVIGYLIYELVFAAVFEGILGQIDKWFGKYQRELRIYPLWHKGMPLTAGIDGHTSLIPGMKDPWYYGSPMGEDPDAPASATNGVDYSGAPEGDGASYDNKAITAAELTAREETSPQVPGQKPLPGSSPPIYLKWPVLSGKISSPYGWRTMEGKKQMHTGIDMAADMGDPVYAAASGEVVEVVYSSEGYGNHVILKHPGGAQTLYAHLSRIDVVKGQWIIHSGLTQQRIGLVGSTGYSTGPHLHFELYIYPKKIDAIREGYIIL